MKNLFLTFVLFLGLQGIAQKTVYIFNNSTTATITIGDIQTKKATFSSTPGTAPTLGYPTFTSFTNTPIIIPPGGSYTLENTANPNKFPFISVGNSPQITQWVKFVSANSFSTVSSTQAFTTASSQIFYSIKFMGGAGGGTLVNPAIWKNTYDDNIADSNPTPFLVPNYGLPNTGTSRNPIGLGGSPGTQWSFIEYDAPSGIYSPGTYAIILGLSDN